MTDLKRHTRFNGPMTRALARVRKVGGSLMVTIPKELVEQEGIREGEVVDLEIWRAQRSLFGFTPEIGPFTKDDRMKDHD
jgi:anaerobic selenocysteine-containing dehydrogenase